MAKHSSNGHVSVNGKSNGALKDIVRAPAGGIRAGGKWYQGGARMPEKYRRMLRSDRDGDDVHGDPAAGLPLTAPNFGRVPLPHAMTFIGKQSTISHVYRNPDEAVQRSGGQSWKMRRDPSIMECLEARQRATALLGWHLEVEDEKDPRQKQLKDEMTKVIARTYQFTEYRRVLLEALWYGRYAVEHRYGFEVIGGKRRTIIKGWVPINGDKLVFRFDDGSGQYRDDEVGVRVSPVYNQDDKLSGDRHLEMTDQGMAYFLEPWERSLFAIHRHIIEDGDYEDPISAGRIHGVGIRDRIYWCWYQKQETMAQLMEVIERTGSGITIYWYPAGDPKAKAEVEEMAEQQRNENVLIMPRMSGDPAMDAYGIERVEPTTAGIQAMQGVVDEFFGDQIMRYINGGTLFSKSKSLGIGGGASDTQEQSFYLIVQYDSVKLEETITHEMVTPLKRFNCPWADDIPLLFKIDTDSPDAQEKLQAAKTLWDMGAKIKTAEVMGKVGLSMPTEDDEVLQNPAAMGQGMPGAMPGMPPGAEGQGGEAPEGSLQDLFGPLADGLGGGDDSQPPNGPDDGGDQPGSPFNEGGGPAQYAKDEGRRYYTRDELKQAIADTDTDATEAQREAGNYAKGKLNWHGLTISLENPAGTKRRPEWKALAHHYGYINRTEGRDGDHVDVFIGPHPESELVFVIDQEDKDGHFDEHKCMLGFTNEQEAIDGYLANYEDGWNLGPVTPMSLPAFQQWLKTGDMDRAVSSEAVRYAKRQIRSSPGQRPLPGVVDANTKQHHLWKEELHPRDGGGRWVEKGGKGAPKQFGQGMLFNEMAAKLHQSEQHPDPKAGKAAQKSLFDLLARSEVHPEQVAALLSGDDQRLRDLEKKAIATGQHEHSPQPLASGADWLKGVDEAKQHREAMSAAIGGEDDEPKPWEGWSAEEMAMRPLSKHNPEWYDGVKTTSGMTMHVENNGDGTYSAWKSFDKHPENKLPVSSGRDAEMTMNNIWRGGMGLSPGSPEMEQVIQAGMDRGQQLTPADRENLPDHLKDINPAFPSEVEKLKGIAAGGAQEPSPPDPEPSKTPPAGMPGGSSQQDGGDGFSLTPQKAKIGRGIGTEDKTPEISKGRQNAFFHGLDDAPGQNKLFGGLDLAGGPDEPPPAAQESAARPSTYVNGDRAEYTGKTVNGMHELELMEGLHAGTHRVTARGPDGSDPYSDRNKQAWKDQQEEFSRLHQPSDKSPDGNGAQVAKHVDPYKQALKAARNTARKTTDVKDNELREVAGKPGGREYLDNSQQRGSRTKEPHEMTLDEWADHYGGVTADQLRSPEDGTRADDARKELDDWRQKAKRFGRGNIADIEQQKEPADNAIVNVPLSKRGDIDAEIDRHKAEQAKAGKQKRSVDAAQAKEDKEVARALLEKHGEKIAERVAAKNGGSKKDAMKAMDSMVKWEPGKARKLLEAEDAKSQPAEEPEPAKSAPMSLATLASHSDQIRKGEASADQIRQWFSEYHANQEPIRQELAKKTVAELKKMGAGGWHANGMKKDDLVKDALQRIGQQYHVKESFSWSPMTESHADALKRAIDKQTDDDVKAHAARHAARAAEYQGRVESFKKSLDNPETLEEFQQHVRANNGTDKLSDEQLAKYDDLRATDRRQKAAAQRSTVKGFSGGEQKAGATGIVEGHHQKRNSPTYTVTVENRLGDDGFREALSRAKTLGGSYVNAMIAKRYGATAGFQFFDRASAEQFSKVLKGESVDRSEAEGERKAEKIENASERLKALAETTHAAADEQLNADRKTNTHKRAEQAASAEAHARGQKALAETMERLSDAMAGGEAKHLEGIRNRQHVVELNRQLRAARNSRMKAEGSHKLPYDQYEEMSGRPPEDADIRHVEYPHPKFWQSQLLSHAGEFENEPGLKLIAARLKKAAAATVKFKGQGGGYKFSGGQVVAPKEFEHPELHSALKVNGLKEGQGVRVHQSFDWRLANKGKGSGPFYTADAGKSFGTSPDIAVSAALNRGHALDLVDLPQDELITLNDPREIADLSAAVSRLRRSSNRSLRRTAEELHSRLDSYNRLQAMDIKNGSELRAALREYMPLRTKPKGEDKIKKLERSLVGNKIEGFFPTPRPLVERMIDAAGIESGHSVLEPSAGKGDILDAVRERHPDAHTEAIEPHSSLRDLIEAKGHNLVGRDFLEHGGQYDRVLMNPPFERGQDAEHVQHAFKNLKDGGRIVAIMSAGPFQRSDKKAQAFRDWFESVGGTVEDLPAGSFAGSDAFRQTGVNTKLVVIDK